MSLSLDVFFAMLCSGIAVIALVLFLNAIRLRFTSSQHVLNSPKSIPEYPNTPFNPDGSYAQTSCFLLRFLWPWLVMTGHLVKPFMTWNFRARLTQSLNQSGIKGWSCVEFFSLQLLLSGTSLLLVFLMSLLALPLGDIEQLILCLIVALIAGCLPRVWLRSRKLRRYEDISRGLPFFLDMVTLGLEAGMNIQTSVQLALDHLDSGSLKEEWMQTIFEIRSGVNRVDAFRNMSQRIDLPCIRQMVMAFIQAESIGMSLSKSVGAFSNQQSQFRLLRAEQLALQAPIKMLFPLAFCIFPCTFLILAFPVVAQLMGLER